MRYLPASLLLAALGLLAGLILIIPTIHAYERAAGYPYGRMCNSVFTGFQDTCR